MILQTSTGLGIELGSTRIKAVLAGPDGSVLASGAHDWENRFEDGWWTYHLEDVCRRACSAAFARAGGGLARPGTGDAPCGGWGRWACPP